jgi:hypothetical protein
VSPSTAPAALAGIAGDQIVAVWPDSTEKTCKSTQDAKNLLGP